MAEQQPKNLSILDPTQIIRYSLHQLIDPLIDSIAKQIPIAYEAKKHLAIYEQYITDLSPKAPLIHVTLRLTYRNTESDMWKRWKQHPESFPAEPMRYLPPLHGEAQLIIGGLPSGELTVNLRASVKATGNVVQVLDVKTELLNACGSTHYKLFKDLFSQLTVASIMAGVVEEWVEGS